MTRILSFNLNTYDQEPKYCPSRNIMQICPEPLPLPLHLSPLLSISGSEKMNLSFTFLLLPFFLILLLKTIAIRADSEEHPCAEVKCPTVHQHKYFGVRDCPCVHCTLSLGVHTNVMSIVSTGHTDIHV